MDRIGWYCNTARVPCLRDNIVYSTLNWTEHSLLVCGGGGGGSKSYFSSFFFDKRKNCSTGRQFIVSDEKKRKGRIRLGRCHGAVRRPHTPFQNRHKNKKPPPRNGTLKARLLSRQCLLVLQLLLCCVSGGLNVSAGGPCYTTLFIRKEEETWRNHQPRVHVHRKGTSHCFFFFFFFLVS
jgi:hypothetical protein